MNATKKKKKAEEVEKNEGMDTEARNNVAAGRQNLLLVQKEKKGKTTKFWAFPEAYRGEGNTISRERGLQIEKGRLNEGGTRWKEDARIGEKGLRKVSFEEGNSRRMTCEHVVGGKRRAAPQTPKHTPKKTTTQNKKNKKTPHTKKKNPQKTTTPTKNPKKKQQTLVMGGGHA